MNGDTWIFLALCGALLVFLLMASFLSKSYSLDRIKSKTVGDGQHGTARWATPKEIGKTITPYPSVPAAGARERSFPRYRASFSAAWAAESAEIKKA